LCLGAIIYFEFEKLKLSYPTVSEAHKAQLQLVKKELLAEDGASIAKPQPLKKSVTRTKKAAATSKRK
jgi:hypothetical protein